MLKYLHIQNLVLIENATLTFYRGLNILTGETGSGKSAIMQALRLTLGDRADSNLIRKGYEKAVVEAEFEINDSISTLLLEAGFQVETELIIKREITTQGKGKIYINHQLAQVSFLRKISSYIVQLIDQHANQNLLSLPYHRQVVDLFGEINPLCCDYRKRYDEEQKLEDDLNLLLQKQAKCFKDVDLYQRELEELQEADLKMSEDEELFKEYTLLSHAEERSKKVYEINQALSGDKHPLLVALNRARQMLKSLVNLDESLDDCAQLFDSACIDLQEVSQTLLRYEQSIQPNYERLNEINDRLTLINRLKRKYGPEIESILSYQKQIKIQLNDLDQIDKAIEKMKFDLQRAKKETQEYADKLSIAREAVSRELEKKVTHQLQSLNMQDARFSIRLEKRELTRDGQDAVEFFLISNKGEREVALIESASGGEISRILFALQVLLAGKIDIPTLIFDEIDANIGGQTATLIGHQLHQMSQNHQVLCITHLPQVANQADHHFQVEKQEKNGRTHTLIRELNADLRLIELARMAGKTHKSSEFST